MNRQRGKIQTLSQICDNIDQMVSQIDSWDLPQISDTIDQLGLITGQSDDYYHNPISHDNYKSQRSGTSCAMCKWDVATIQWTECEHKYCVNCIQQIVIEQLSLSNKIPKCVYTKCGESLNIQSIHQQNMFKVLYPPKYQITISLNKYNNMDKLIHGYVRTTTTNMYTIPNDIMLLIFDYYYLNYVRPLKCDYCKTNDTNDTIQIFINTFNRHKIIGLQVHPNDSIYEVKVKIEKQQNIAPKQQILKYADKWLRNEKTLSDYNIQKESTLQLHYDPNGKQNYHPNYAKNCECALALDFNKLCNKQSLCVKCNEYYPIDSIMYWFKCNHCLCDVCFISYSKHKIEENEIPICPQIHCKQEIAQCISLVTSSDLYGGDREFIRLQNKLNKLINEKYNFKCARCNEWHKNIDVCMNETSNCNHAYGNECDALECLQCLSPCEVCGESDKNQDLISWINCGHKYHKKCAKTYINEWDISIYNINWGVYDDLIPLCIHKHCNELLNVSCAQTIGINNHQRQGLHLMRKWSILIHDNKDKIMSIRYPSKRLQC